MPNRSAPLILASTLIALVAMMASGCSYLNGREAAREHDEARVDHEVCASRELTFSSDAYTDCRRQLAEERQKHQWLELSLAQQQTRAVDPSFVPQQQQGVYRDIDSARFACEQHGSDADQEILCREH